MNNYTEAVMSNFKSNLANNDIKISEASAVDIHEALADAVMTAIEPQWHASYAERGRKRACYLSAEFLVGRAVFNNIFCLGVYDEVAQLFKDNGSDINRLEEIEDAALGNGGLGRLAACFLDSAATLDLPLDGYGIRYKYGLFKQTIVNGRQCESADNWTKYGDPWSKKCARETVIVHYADGDVKAVPYDMPIIGYKSNTIGTLRLWEAEAIDGFDFQMFNDQHYNKCIEKENRVLDISRVLYPNDDTVEGKRLRIRQEYFFSAASIGDIVNKFIKAHGRDISHLPEFYAVQLNDTHPIFAIPELIRILMQDFNYLFEDAFCLARKVFSYTNHTVMAEALEKWNDQLVFDVIPRVFETITLIQNRFNEEMNLRGVHPGKKAYCSMINNNTIHMANLACYATSYINGVAEIHTEILKNDVLKDWYGLYPEKFQNKTNGITQRRWLGLCNPDLTKYLGHLFGNIDFLKDLSKIKELENYLGDVTVLETLNQIKRSNKVKLQEYIRQHDNLEINPDSIYDIQVKRLHEYKRQFMNALSILYLYFEIKDGNIKDFYPTTFIFGAKAAPGYRRAKAIIKLINDIAKLINNDKTVSPFIKVVFVANYNVSYGEKLFAAADVSEQISPAGTEASGTGNMKFMLNGAVTIGTYDGANVEIVREAGVENNFIFGADINEINSIKNDYDPTRIYNSDPKIKRVLDTLIDGTFEDADFGFLDLHNSILKGAAWHKPDNYFVLHDFNSYIEAKLKVNSDYKNRLEFAKKAGMNIANSGKFSSDRTILDYAENIWKIK